ncbi:hypothetical protein [Thermoactinospora rubra]|nr:hypothetical protein [Thermoactinospora rubra]
MSRQIAIGYQAPFTSDLEARVRVLEARLAHLTELVEAMTRAVEQKP